MAGLARTFTDAIVEVEEAAATLLDARRTGSLAKARDAAARGGSCPQLIIEAADLIASLGEAGEARALLAQGLSLGGPTAPLQHAYARHCRDAGDLDEAARWLQGAMLRARPNAAMALELCEIDYARGDPAAAADALALSVRLRWLDPAGLRTAYRRLLDAGHGEAAIVPAMMLRRRNADDADLRAGLAELLHIHAPYGGLPAPVVDAFALGDAMTAIIAAGAAAHDVLMAGFDPARIIGEAREREASERWIGADDLWPFLKAKVDLGEPFSFVRMSDGEGRFVAALHRPLFPWLDDAAAQAMLRQIWMNWFGQEVRAVPPEALARLAGLFGQAVRNAGLLGRTSAAMYEHDATLFGYRAALDRWYDREAPPAGQHGSDAAYTLFLNQRDPLLTGLLAGQPFIGAISPYADLAARLAARIGIAGHRDHVIPGETRLDRAEERGNRGAHFPETFDRLMAGIEVPHRGACFVVAGGLLGKIYCERIRELGGIALDIGALADGWMGYNSRGHGFDAAMAGPSL